MGQAFRGCLTSLFHTSLLPTEPTDLGRGFIPFPTPAVDNPPFASVRIGEEGLGRETESGEHLCNKKRENNP